MRKPKQPRVWSKQALHTLLKHKNDLSTAGKQEAEIALRNHNLMIHVHSTTKKEA